MTDITHEALVKRGFEPNIYGVEEYPQRTYRKRVGQVRIDVLDGKVELGTELEWTIVPNCRTLADLDNLIKLFV